MEAVRPATFAEIAADLIERGVVEPECSQVERLEKTTSDAVGFLGVPGEANPRYVLKQNDPEAVIAEATYARAYAHLPWVLRVHYLDPTHEFVVYQHIPGLKHQGSGERIDPATMLTALSRDVFSHYESIEVLAARPGGEWLYAPANPHRSWQHRVLDWLPNMRRKLDSHFGPAAGDLAAALTLCSRARQERLGQDALALVHGDLGPHNFIVDRAHGEPRLSGIIDPYPALAMPFYDLAHAFSGWGADLSPETLLPAAEALGRWQLPDQRTLMEELLPVLYWQASACLSWHPEDFHRYPEAWHYWTNRLAEASG